MRLALSTMTAQHERFDDGAVFARQAAAWGYDAIELSHSTSAEKADAIINTGRLPIVSIHQPAPWERLPSGVANCDLNLASIDKEMRAAAVAAAERSIRMAAKVGAGAVVLHLGAVSDVPLPADEALRAHIAGGGDPADVPRIRADAVEARAAIAEPAIDAARRSLMELYELARPLGIVLGVESRLNFHEIPLPHELPFLLEGLDSSLAGYWHDMGHVEVLARLGYATREAWFEQPGVRCVGAHLHDVAGLVDHRAPGCGDIDWHLHLARIRHLEVATFEINQFQPDEAVAAAPGFVRGVLQELGAATS